MYKCPVCEKESSSLLCQNCGFDSSCNYEAYPSLKTISGRVDSIRARKAALEEQEKDLLRCPACGSTSLSVDKSLQFSCNSCRHKFSPHPPAEKAEKKEEPKPDPVQLKVDNYLVGLSVVEKIKKEQAAQAAQKPPVPPKPDNRRKGAVRILVAAFCILAGIGIAAALLGPGQKQSLNVNTLPISEEIKSLVAAGTEDTYTYMDGSQLEQYFDGSDLEAARIYKDKAGQIECVFTAEYDGSGNVLEHLTFDGTGALVRTDSFTRNADGEWMEHLVTLKDGALGRKYQRTFTPDGNIERETEWAADGTLVEEKRNFFDEEGNYTGCTYLDGFSEQYTEEKNGNTWLTEMDAEGNITGKTEFRHDENDVQTGTYYYDAAGNLLKWNEWVHNARGDVSKRTDYNADSTIDGIYEYDYDADGNETATRTYQADGSMEEETSRLYGSGGAHIGSFSTNYGETTSTDRTESVKSIIGTMHKQLGQYRSDTYYSDTVIDFNPLGLADTYISYDQNGRPTYESQYYYDAKGNEVEITTISRSYDSSGRLSHENKTTEDAQGNSAGMGKSYDEDGNLEYTSEHQKTYDADGNALEASKTYDPEGRLTSEHVLNRAPNGDYITHNKSYDKAGKVTETSESEYRTDTEGNQTRHYKSYNADGSLSYESAEQTDPLGNSAETRKHYNSDGTLSRITETSRTYGEDGTSTRIEETWDAQGRITETIELVYDADGNAVSGQRVSTTYYNDGRKTVTTYDHNYDRISREEYDASGNLISKE